MPVASPPRSKLLTPHFAASLSLSQIWKPLPSLCPSSSVIAGMRDWSRSAQRATCHTWKAIDGALAEGRSFSPESLSSSAMRMTASWERRTP